MSEIKSATCFPEFSLMLDGERRMSPSGRLKSGFGEAHSQRQAEAFFCGLVETTPNFQRRAEY